MDVRVTRNDDEQRFEAHDGKTLAGFAAYAPRESSLVFTHTEVDPAYEGRGVGAALARTGLDDARERNLKVVPLCPFIRAWIDRHPDYEDLVQDAPPSRVTD